MGAFVIGGFTVGALYKMTHESMADAIMESDFKREIVSEAQRQLLFIKVVEYMEQKMLENT